MRARVCMEKDMDFAYSLKQAQKLCCAGLSLITRENHCRRNHVTFEVKLTDVMLLQMSLKDITQGY